MKDFLDRELSIGDDVVTTPKNYRGLVRAKVIAFTPQKVRVVYRHHRGHDEEFITYPTAVIKII